MCVVWLCWLLLGPVIFSLVQGVASCLLCGCPGSSARVLYSFLSNAPAADYVSNAEFSLTLRLIRNALFLKYTADLAEIVTGVVMV